MRKKVVITLSILGFVFIFIGIGINFVYSLKNDREATLLRMDDVTEEYKNFGVQVDVFNDIRNSLYLNVFENTYYDTMGANDSEVKMTFSNYEVSVNNVEVAASNLANLCGTIYFPNSGVNSKCKGFASVYEQVVNAFVSDVELYNSNISQYNDYQKENGSTSLLENYKTDKAYIDYNNDNKYEGKDE